MDILVRLASGKDIREARKIVEEQYAKSGYLPADSSVFFKSLAVYLPYSYTLAAIKNNQLIGTLTLIVDSAYGLPMDKIYSEENNILRKNNRSLSELSMFAVKEGRFKCSLLLCKYVQILASRIVGCTDFVITVNPKHCSFYRNILQFTGYSSEKEHPVLKNAKTIPLRLNLLTLEETYKRVSHKKRSFNLHEFFFGAHSFTIEKELRAALC